MEVSKNELILVEQIPVIKQYLNEVKTDITKRVENALSLVCTEDTVKTVKEERAALNKELKFWEEKRKEVKKAVLSPYEQFEAVYKDCISDIFKKADVELKAKIDNVENELKEQKTTEVMRYFYEYVDSKGVGGDFLSFDRANINITLSASMKSLKEQAKAFIDRICDDLNLIRTQEHKDEIFYEYKQSLNVSGAITTVVNRYKAIEEAKAKAEEQKAKAEAEQKAVEKVETVIETLTPPVEEEKILTLKFTVRGTMPQLKALKEFLNNGGYDYE